MKIEEKTLTPAEASKLRAKLEISGLNRDVTYLITEKVEDCYIAEVPEPVN